VLPAAIDIVETKLGER